MNRLTPSSLTISRQVVIALTASLLVTLALAVVAALAVDRVGDAKQQVIDREARLVVDAYRLDLGVAERGVAVRNLLMTGDEAYLPQIQAADVLYADALAALQGNVHTDEGRRLLDEVVRRKGELDAATQEAVSQRLDGRLGPEELPDLIDGQLTPLRRALTDAVDSFIDREEQLIARAIEQSEETVETTVRLVWVLAVVGLGLAIGIGGWITRNVSRTLIGLARSIDAAAAEILAGTAQQAGSASQQAAAIQQTVATAEELAQTAEQSAARARAVADGAQQAAQVADAGATAVDASASAMADIQQQVDAIATTVVALAERAQDISGIVRTVEDLAGEIHLLALNAAIEAARAGEHGRGFSVVAGEVRALADQSKRATSQITGILDEIRQGTDSAVMATEQGGKSVAGGVQTVQRTGATIKQLADGVAASAIAAEQISASSGQQAVATTQINHAMRELGESAQQNAAAARQAEQAARDLTGVALGLKALVGAE